MHKIGAGLNIFGKMAGAWCDMVRKLKCFCIISIRKALQILS